MTKYWHVPLFTVTKNVWRPTACWLIWLDNFLVFLTVFLTLRAYCTRLDGYNSHLTEFYVVNNLQSSNTIFPSRLFSYSQCCKIIKTIFPKPACFASVLCIWLRVWGYRILLRVSAVELLIFNLSTIAILYISKLPFSVQHVAAIFRFILTVLQITKHIKAFKLGISEFIITLTNTNHQLPATLMRSTNLIKSARDKTCKGWFRWYRTHSGSRDDQRRLTRRLWCTTFDSAASLLNTPEEPWISWALGVQ